MYAAPARILVVKPFVCQGEVVPAGVYLSPGHVRVLGRKLAVMMSNATLKVVPDPHDRRPVLPGVSTPTYLNPKALQKLIADTLVAAFTHTETALQVAVDGSTSTGTRTRTDWVWDFGDGTKVTEQDANATHTYAAPGTYTVKLQVMDTWDALSLPVSHAVTVAGVLTPAFSSTPTLLSVAFNAGASTATGDIVSYVWDFGDGSDPVTDTDATITHVYDEAGTYTVSLTIVDEWDEQSTPVTHDVTVAAA